MVEEITGSLKDSCFQTANFKIKKLIILILAYSLKSIDN